MLKRAILGAAAVLFAASAGFAASQTAKTAAKSWSGYVTDSKCAMNAKMRTNEACIKKCVDAGDKYVLYDTYNHKVYQLDPQSDVAEHASHHVRVYGALDGDTIHVTKVAMLGTAKPAMKKPAASPGL